MSFCTHASPALCARMSAVENVLDSGTPLSKFYIRHCFLHLHFFGYKCIHKCFQKKCSIIIKQVSPIDPIYELTPPVLYSLMVDCIKIHAFLSFTSLGSFPVLNHHCYDSHTQSSVWLLMRPEAQDTYPSLVKSYAMIVIVKNSIPPGFIPHSH